MKPAEHNNKTAVSSTLQRKTMKMKTSAYSISDRIAKFA
jgi:hypothetical protein